MDSQAGAAMEGEPCDSPDAMEGEPCPGRAKVTVADSPDLRTPQWRGSLATPRTRRGQGAAMEGEPCDSPDPVVVPWDLDLAPQWRGSAAMEGEPCDSPDCSL